MNLCTLAPFVRIKHFYEILDSLSLMSRGLVLLVCNPPIR